jgi:hypothetical protein
MAIKTMGHFTAIGMRQKVDDNDALVINTCGDNGTAEKGSMTRWSWANPTNTKIQHACPTDPKYTAVSTECMWQGTKIFIEGGKPDLATLNGDWRRGKAKKPIGAWNGENPLICTPGEARIAIYIPTFKNQVEYWLKDEEVASWLKQAKSHSGPVYLRDHDTGRGVHRKGPMSHAWLLAEYLNSRLSAMSILGGYNG